MRHSRRLGDTSVRSPEMLLGNNWDSRANIWSVGAMVTTPVFEILTSKVFEMVGGDALISPWRAMTLPTNEQRVLFQLIEICGPVPERMQQEGRNSERFTNGNIVKTK